ncbi:hypothetical protein NECAME_18808, partial [Necator americanus]
SCVENACENTSPSDQLKAFSHTANNSPGYTFCSQSCGCITCEGCFFCQPSCLFYRIYALPTSHTIYTVFNCPSWETIVNAEVTIRQEGSTITNTLQLYPGQTTTWNNLRFSLIGTLVPQLPILSSTFMETDMGISIIKPAHKGQLATHNAGQLYYSTKQHAEQRIFASKACTCTHGLREASCMCSPGDMEELMKALPLPLVSKSFIILSRNKQVYAKPNIESTLQLHLVAENMKITTHLSNTTCEIETSDIIGCYDCVTGAEVSLYCRSSEGQTIANIECTTENQVALCTANGHLKKARLPLSDLHNFNRMHRVLPRRDCEVHSQRHTPICQR